MDDPAMQPSCGHLVNPDPWMTGLSVFLILGTIGSYLPQHFKIIHQRTSAGLAPYWVLLGAVTSTFGLATTVTASGSQRDIACCQQISRGECAAGMLGIVTVATQWACFMVVMILFLVYFPKSDEQQLDQDTPSTSPPLRKRDAVTVGSVSLLAILFAVTGTIIIHLTRPNAMQPWADFLGIVAGIVAAVQYLPQIYTTYKLGELLSLSIWTMAIQVPGGFLFAFALWLRLGTAGWSAWLVYVLTAFIQGVLLGMAISFILRDWRLVESGDGAHAPDGSAMETDPLLPSSDGRGGTGQNGSPRRDVNVKRIR